MVVQWTDINFYIVRRPSFSNLGLFQWKNSEGKLVEFRLIEHVSAKWKEMGRLLDMSNDELDGISRKTLNDNAESCWSVFSRWIGSNHVSYPPTWTGLLQLLRGVRKERIAEEMKTALKTFGIEFDH